MNVHDALKRAARAIRTDFAHALSQDPDRMAIASINSSPKC